MTYPVWHGSGWVDATVPTLDGEALVLPGVAAILYPDTTRSAVLLQRRDKPGEPTRGLLEIPTGKWQAGESARTAVRREVREETGLDVVDFLHEEVRVEPQYGRPFVAVQPLTTAVGVDGAYPTLIVAFECVARGDPVPAPGDAVDPAWYSWPELGELLNVPAHFTGPSFAILSHLVARR